MDGKEQLRRYLEQRREAGERELVLDGMSVDEVMRLLGAAGAGGAAGTGEASAGHSPRGTGATPASTPGTGHVAADWRDVLRGTGAGPEAGARQRQAPAPGERAPTPPVSAKGETPPTEAPAAAVPAGINIAAGDRELFGAVAALESLDAIAATVASCTRCPLYATATNPVPGTGNPSARLVVVGEAPGATEDEQGKPFVGAAGQMLTKILASVDLDR